MNYFSEWNLLNGLTTININVPAKFNVVYTDKIIEPVNSIFNFNLTNSISRVSNEVTKIEDISIAEISKIDTDDKTTNQNPIDQPVKSSYSMFNIFNIFFRNKAKRNDYYVFESSPANETSWNNLRETIQRLK